MKLTPFVKFIICSQLLSSCGGDMYDYCGHSNGFEAIYSHIAPEELLGTYVPDDKTKNKYQGFDSEKTYIKITSENDVFISSMPKMLMVINPFESDSLEHITSNGTWNTSYQQIKGSRDTNLDLHFIIDSVNIEQTFNPFPLHGDIRVYKKDDKYVLVSMVSDPDLCQAVRFIQK